MKKLFIILILVSFIGCNSNNDYDSKKNEFASIEVVLTVKSKLNHDVEIGYGFSYSNNNALTDEDPIIKKINANIIDSLHRYEMHELSVSRWDAIENIIKGIIIFELNNNKIEIENGGITLWSITLPAEYLTGIRTRIEFLDKKLEIDSSLSESEYKQINQELDRLEKRLMEY